ncbi:VWA domain-containing protein [Paenibacillus herberti]|uniref:VWFA domain-containing protein n=1 Tax=Paenibacillus herberti TaxID=1619309 RepID=A0A229P527_9BACL|nr:vWA domain-containing protein [Paenibacillus herberti]OXM17200.1 hypothetical protein CGZ75_11500 [Paenibacillus herberti]
MELEGLQKVNKPEMKRLRRGSRNRRRRDFFHPAMENGLRAALMLGLIVLAAAASGCGNENVVGDNENSSKLGQTEAASELPSAKGDGNGKGAETNGAALGESYAPVGAEEIRVFNGAVGENLAPSGTEESNGFTGENDEGSKPAKGSEDRSFHKPEIQPQQPKPQAGMLTAGEWDDHFSWNNWLKLMRDGRGTRMTQAWGFESYFRLTVELTNGGEPARDVEVQLQCKSTKEWTARTDSSGITYLFASLLGGGEMSGQSGKPNPEPAKPDSSEQKDPQSSVENAERSKPSIPQDCTIQVPADKTDLSSYVVQDKEWNGETIKINVAGKLTQPKKTLDLMLVVDTTGSMADELKYLSEELTNVVSSVKMKNGQNLNIRISPNFYRDEGDEYVIRSFPFQEDAAKAQAQIAAQEADGGQDYPEAVDAALLNAINEHDWNASATARLMLLVLDAPPHRGQKELERIGQMTQTAAEKGIRIIPVAASGTDLETEMLMRSIAIATGGTYVFLTDDSGIGNSHKKPEGIEPQIMPLNDLLVGLISGYVSP